MTDTNGSGKDVQQDLELQICQTQDKLLKLVEEEDFLRERKNEVAADYREQIKGVRKARKDVTTQLKALQTEEVESAGTLIIEAADEVQTTQASA
jgi:hypothetical protein